MTKNEANKKWIKIFVLAFKKRPKDVMTIIVHNDKQYYENLEDANALMAKAIAEKGYQEEEIEIVQLWKQKGKEKDNEKG